MALLCALLLPVLFSPTVQAGSLKTVSGVPSVSEGLRTMISTSEEPVPVIVLFKTDAGFREKNPLLREELVRPVLRRKVSNLKSVRGLSGIRTFRLLPACALMVTPEGLDELLLNPDIAKIETDENWPLHTAEGKELIGVATLQNYGFTGQGKAIAIIDTGVDAFHPALGGKAIPNLKIVRGLDTADDDEDPQDCAGHGTAVASIAAGVSYQWSPVSYFAGGVAPDAKLLVYKAASDANCNSLRESAVIMAIEDALLHAHGEDYELVAINISGGGGEYIGACDDVEAAMSAVVHLAVENGVAVIASSGNDGLGNGLAAPACLRDVISVGSVWDSDAEFSGSLFCLDAACSETCDDSGKKKSEPACYSNSGRELDLLAPSEYLLVADAGAQTTSFGGTSGAAPYVSGTIALLEKAYPQLSPGRMRFLLRATGLPRTDSKNMRSTPMLNALTALSERTFFSEEDHLPIGYSGDGILAGELLVPEGGEIGELRLLLRIQHPHPSSLKVTLRAPDGRCVIVEDHPEDLEGDFSTYYPVSRLPVEGLEFFSGSDRAGTWRLEIEDENRNENAFLEGWALYFSDPIPLDENSQGWLQILPIAARGPGANQTQWKTSLRLFNPSMYYPVELRIYFIPESLKRGGEILQRNIFLPGRALLEIDDLFDSIFGEVQATGEIILRNPGWPLLSTSRITTESAQDGRFGQFISPAQGRDDARSYLGHISGGEQFRSNLGISELDGHSATATIRLFSTDTGDPVADPIRLDLRAYSLRRLDRILEIYAPGVQDAWAAVDSNESVQAWVSIVDELSGDATFVPAVSAGVKKFWLVPVIARSSGRAESTWRTQVRILNPGAESRILRLEFRNLVFQSVMTRDLEVGPGEVAILEDPVLQLFGQESGSGSLRILPLEDETALVISTRIYNQTERGSYGQSIPVVTEGSRAASSIIEIEDSQFRHSNLVICEASGEALTLRMSLRDSQDHLQADPVEIVLAPWESRQINDLFVFLQARGSGPSRLDIVPSSGEGSFVAFASIVDDLSGDALSIPAQLLPADN